MTHETELRSTLVTTYGATEQRDEEIKANEGILVSELSEEDKTVGGQWKFKIETIFSRISDGMPIYESLGREEGIAEKLKVDLINGASSDTVQQRRDTFGSNILPEDEPVTFWQIYFNSWSDYMIILLTISAIVSIIIGMTVPEHKGGKVDYSKGWIEGVAILFSVFLVTTISSVNDYQKELKFRQLTEENSKVNISVLRDGGMKTIDVTEIVVGDIVSINPGLIMPCDAFFIKGMSVVIDESTLTGEIASKHKNADDPFFLTGTTVNTAESTLVLAGGVGMNSFGGKLLMGARCEGVRLTPLQDRLNNMAVNIGKVGITVAALLFVILCIIEGVRFAKKDPAADGRHFLSYFIIAVTVIVVAVPEGLPLAVVISLAYSQNKMRQDNNQVRRLQACETMGNATTICSDKTGTLTQNLMSVVQGYCAGSYFSIKKPGDYLEKINLNQELDIDAVLMMCDIISVNSSSVKTVCHCDSDKKEIPKKWVWSLDKGNKTDNALIDLADRLSLEESDITDFHTLPHQRSRKSALVDGEYEVFPFTSDRKRMSTIVHRNGKNIMYIKGGADYLLPDCAFYRDAGGAHQPMTTPVMKTIEGKILNFAINANRNIGLAYRILGDECEKIPIDEPQGDYVWLGVLGIQDPLRPEVIAAVSKCQHAGVVVRMCTGDNIDTALAISRQCGIFQHGDIALTGREFRNIIYDAYSGREDGEARLTPILNRMTVLARSQPLDKQLLVLMHMIRGEVVAVTGDGTNDAPALKLANVGFVMRSGTDIALKAADIVLLDDNFRSVQRAVVWGRTVNDNIRKFLQLQLSVNVVSVTLTFVGSIASKHSTSPLSSVQLLWVNLIMDTFAALALATEGPNEECLNRGPVNRKSSLISRRMWLFIISQSIYQLTCTFVAEYAGHLIFNVGRDSKEHRTIVFNIFVWCTIFNMFNARKLYREKNVFEGMSRSIPFIVIMGIIVVIQILCIELFGDFITTHPLKWQHWVSCIGISVIVWPVCLLQKLIPIPEVKLTLDFQLEEMDEDIQNMFKCLQKEIKCAVANRTEEEQAQNGKALEAAMRLQTLALWRKVHARYVLGSTVIRAFHRAHQDKDLKTGTNLELYQTLRDA